MYEHEGGQIKIFDDHHHRLVVRPSVLLRPGALAVITPPNQKVILLSRADTLALRDYLNVYLRSTE